MNKKIERKIRRLKRKLKRPSFYGFLAALFCVVFGSFWLLKFRILPVLLLVILIDVEIVLLWLIWYLLVKRHRKWMQIVGWLLSIILCASNLAGGYFYDRTWNALEKMNVNMVNTGDYVDLDVLRDSVIESVEDLNDRKIGIMRNMDPEQRKLMTDWLDLQNISYTIEEFDSSLLMARNLKGMAIDAIIIYQPYLSVLENYEDMDTFRQDLRTLHQIPCESVPTKKADAVDVTTTPFTVLISGIDTYGAIGTNGRSDVNILMTVNPVTRSVLLVSIPRDYYVDVKCDEVSGCLSEVKDKLTHTGIYGTAITEQTLENLFGIEINYTVRINFSSLIQIVDALGGIEVNNVDTFSIGGYDFEPGTLHLDGDMALQFSRERYSFKDGDRERGRNQMRVIQGMINKAISPKILESYLPILNAVSESVQMNLTPSEVANLVNMQLSHPSSWQIYTYSVSGSDATDFAPALGDNAYVMIPDEEQVNNARLDIQALENGEKPLYTGAIQE